MGAGDTVGGIHRRHSPNGRDQGDGQGPCIWPDISFLMPRIHNKLREDNPRTIIVVQQIVFTTYNSLS